jgi:cytidylate kinase
MGLITNGPHVAIAIDGPAASGKSTIARKIAEKLGLVMINSGAMYRAVAWKILQLHIGPTDNAAVLRALETMDIQCGIDGMMSTVVMDGKVLSDELREENVNRYVSVTSAIPEVRERLVALQRAFLAQTSLVMEGRDIGSVVFPDTAYKIYVDASPEVRAARRQAEGVTDSVVARDLADSMRATAPLLIADGAVVLENSNHTVASAVAAALDILRSQGLKWQDEPTTLE